MTPRHLAPFALLLAACTSEITGPPSPPVDGCATGACPASAYARSLGDGWSELLDLSVGPGGEALVAGWFAGDLTLGGQTFEAPFPQRAFVASLDPAGGVDWAIATGGYPSSLRAARLPDGGAVLAGSLYEPLELGGTTLASDGPSDLFVAVLSPGGALSAVARIPGDAWVGGVAVAPDGSFFVAGGYQGTFDAVGDADPSPGDLGDAYVLHLTASLDLDWGARAGGAGTDGALGVQALPDGGAAILGRFEGHLSAGDASLDAEGFDAFVARLDPSGAFTWARRPADDADLASPAASLAARADGSLAVVSTESPLGVEGPYALRLRVLSAAGETTEVQSLGEGPWIGQVAASAAGGGLQLAGSYSGPLTLGGAALPEAGDQNGFVAVFGPSGLSWAQAVDGAPLDDFSSATQLAYLVGASAGGRVVIGGQYLGGATVGEAELPSAEDNPRAFVAGF